MGTDLLTDLSNIAPNAISPFSLDLRQFVNDRITKQNENLSKALHDYLFTKLELASQITNRNDAYILLASLTRAMHLIDAYNTTLLQIIGPDELNKYITRFHQIEESLYKKSLPAPVKQGFSGFTLLLLMGLTAGATFALTKYFGRKR